MNERAISHLLAINFVVLFAAGFFLLPVFLHPDQPIVEQLSLDGETNFSNTLPEPQNKSLQLIALGDIMLSRTVADKMLQHGYDYPYQKVAETLREADLVFANLETAVTAGRRIEPI